MSSVGTYCVYFKRGDGLCDIHFGIHTWKECIRTIRREFKDVDSCAVRAFVYQFLKKQSASTLRAEYSRGEAVK